jgi:predicted transcriptional regulator
MFDLIRILTNEHTFKVINELINNPWSNASKIAKNLKIHTATVQSYFEVLEKYGLISSKMKKGLGRPSKLFKYTGGEFRINLDDLTKSYSLKNNKVKEKPNDFVKYSFDVDKEIIKSIYLSKKDKINLDNKKGKLLWLVPNYHSDGENIEKLAESSGLAVIEAIEFLLELKEKDLVIIYE